MLSYSLDGLVFLAFLGRFNKMVAGTEAEPDVVYTTFVRGQV